METLEGKTLGEFLEGCDPEELVKIGADGGTNFIWIGTAGEFREIADGMSADALAKLKQKKKEAVDGLRRALSAPDEWKVYREEFRHFREGGRAPRRVGCYKSISSYGKKVGTKARAVIKAMTALDAFVPYLERPVTRVQDGIDATVVIVSGIEVGKYWLVSEREDNVG